MKSLLLVIVLAALGAGLYISKPTDPKKSFADFLEAKSSETGNTGFLSKQVSQFEAQQVADSCEYHDNFFWINVTQDGKVIYTNVFHRWFNRGDIKASINQAQTKLESDFDALKAKAHDEAAGLKHSEDQVQHSIPGTN